MQPTAELDTSGFRAMAEELSRLSGKSFEHILIQQAGALLKVCLRKTPARTAAQIEKRVSRANNYVEFADGSVVSLWEKADALMFLDESNWDPKTMKGKAPTIENGKSWHEMDGPNGLRWNDARWARWQTLLAIVDHRRKDPKKAIKVRGLAKQTWHQIAAELGIDIGAPGYVKNASGPNGEQFREGQARKILSAAALYIELSNANPLMVGKLDGAGILQRAINARLKAFAIEMEKGVFDDVKNRARRYPGIFTT